MLEDSLGYPDLRSRTVQWLTSDTEDLYDSNYRHQRQKLEKLGWTKDNVNYTFNSYGFRSEEFDNSNSIVFLGCSHTLGIGLPVHEIFATQVASKLKLKCYNLAIGGGSTDTCFRLAYYWLEKLRPKICVYVEPEETRFELKYTVNDKNQFVNCNVSSINSLCSPVKEFYRLWLLNDSNSFLKKQKNLLSIQHICLQNKIKFVKSNVEFVNEDFEDRARDLIHYGIKTHKLKADNILELVHDKY